MTKSNYNKIKKLLEEYNSSEMNEHTADSLRQIRRSFVYLEISGIITHLEYKKLVEVFTTSLKLMVEAGLY